MNSTPGYISEKNENTNLKRYLHHNTHSNIIHNCQDMEATYESIERWKDDEIIYIYNGTLDVTADP